CAFGGEHAGVICRLLRAERLARPFRLLMAVDHSERNAHAMVSTEIQTMLAATLLLQCVILSLLAVALLRLWSHEPGRHARRHDERRAFDDYRDREAARGQQRGGSPMDEETRLARRSLGRQVWPPARRVSMERSSGVLPPRRAA